MRHELIVNLEDDVLAALSQQAEIARCSPAELAARVLEQQFRTSQLAGDVMEQSTRLRIERHLRASVRARS